MASLPTPVGPGFHDSDMPREGVPVGSPDSVKPDPGAPVVCAPVAASSEPAALDARVPSAPPSSGAVDAHPRNPRKRVATSDIYVSNNKKQIQRLYDADERRRMYPLLAPTMSLDTFRSMTTAQLVAAGVARGCFDADPPSSSDDDGGGGGDDDDDPTWVPGMTLRDEPAAAAGDGSGPRSRGGRSSCLGCRHGCMSQRDHSCLAVVPDEDEEEAPAAAAGPTAAAAAVPQFPAATPPAAEPVAVTPLGGGGVPSSPSTAARAFDEESTSSSNGSADSDTSSDDSDEDSDSYDDSGSGDSSASSDEDDEDGDDDVDSL